MTIDYTSADRMTEIAKRNCKTLKHKRDQYSRIRQASMPYRQKEETALV